MGVFRFNGVTTYAPTHFCVQGNRPSGANLSRFAATEPVAEILSEGSGRTGENALNLHLKAEEFSGSFDSSLVAHAPLDSLKMTGVE
jgi:hypothetical protein